MTDSFSTENRYKSLVTRIVESPEYKQYDKLARQKISPTLRLNGLTVYRKDFDGKIKMFIITLNQDHDGVIVQKALNGGSKESIGTYLLSELFPKVEEVQVGEDMEESKEDTKLDPEVTSTTTSTTTAKPKTKPKTRAKKLVKDSK